MTFKLKTVLDKDKKISEIIIEDAKVAYVRLKSPVKKYKSETEYEYCLNFFTDEDTADEWDNMITNTSIKKIKTSEFKDIFHFDPPFPKEKNQYNIKVGARAQEVSKVTGKLEMRDYESIFRPKAYGKTPEGKVKDITKEVLVGNGSTGVIKVAVSHNQHGDHAFLRGLLVTDLIEYEGSEGGSNPFAEYGEMDESTPDFHQDASEPQESEGDFGNTPDDEDNVPF